MVWIFGRGMGLKVVSVIVFLGFFGEASAAIKEIRAAWVTRWEYASNGLDTQAQQERVREIFRLARDGHLNTVFFQVRGQADAFYRSELEPWAASLSGQLGTDPGWDPLALAIEQGHLNGLEVHAWVNVFTCWKGLVPPPRDAVPTPLFWAHPEWICVDQEGNRMALGADDYVWVSPGIPAVRDHVLEVITEIVGRYEVDGVHLDYVRYPGGGYSYDPISTARFLQRKADDGEGSWAGWQRDQVSIFVRSVYDRIQEVRPEVKVSAAVVGVRCASGGGWNGFDRTYQDAASWLASGSVDLVVPMAYRRRTDPFPFGELVSDWVAQASGRQICAGIAGYKYADDHSELLGQVLLARRLGTQGVSIFSQDSLEQGGMLEALKNGVWKPLANVPPMPWKDALPPNPPSDVSVWRLSPDEVMLSWRAPSVAADGDRAAYYNIYRSPSNPIVPSEPDQLVHITTDGVSSWVDRVSSREGFFYAVSALDDGDVESNLSDVAWFGPEKERPACEKRKGSD
ncbi:MAG: family 10 glycosylhydrolase [Candidatus Latescibacterota bacterium]